MREVGTGIALSKASEYHPGVWLDAGAGTDPQALRDIIDTFPPNTVLSRQSADSRNPNLYAYQFPPPTQPANASIASVQNAMFSFNEPEATLFFPKSPAYSFSVSFPSAPLFGLAKAPQFGLFRLPIAPMTPMTAEFNVYELSVQKVPAIWGNVDVVNTTVPINEPVAEARFSSTFRGAAEERFEDGMESAFSKNLESVVRKYSSRTTEEILARLLVDQSLPAGVWAEAMRWLGRADDYLPRESRLWLLEKGLGSPAPAIRDGAILGLSSINDSSAIPYIERAVDAETVRDLRTDMEQVLAQLKKL